MSLVDNINSKLCISVRMNDAEVDIDTPRPDYRNLK